MNAIEPTIEPAEPGGPERHLEQLLRDNESMDEFIGEFVRDLRQRLPGDPGELSCAITLLRAGRADTVAATSAVARDLDERQYELGDGPCLTAVRTSSPVHVRDTGDEARWPQYADLARRAGIGTVLAVPFELVENAGAAFNVYADQPGALAGEMADAVQVEVKFASTAMRLAVRMIGHRETTDNLRTAMASRTAIDTAVGIIMGQKQCRRDEAFDLLTTASNQQDLALRDLAEHVIERTGGPS